MSPSGRPAAGGAPPRVLVYGYYGFRNAGDEAILAGIVRAFRKVEPGTEFVVVSGKAAETRRVHGVEAVSRNRIRRIWQEMGRADLVLAGGGSLLQDVTGLRSIPFYLGLAVMAMLRGRPVVFHAQGVGPIRRWPGRLLTRLVASRVALITVRDPESGEFLYRLGVRHPRLFVAADAALALEPGDPARGRRLLAAAGVSLPPRDSGRPLIGVSVRPWPGRGEPGWHRLAEALDGLARRTGGRVVFLPLQPPADLPVARAVAEAMAVPAAVPDADGWTYRDALDAVAACDLLVGMRYHALVFAAMAGVPPVGVSYDPKIDAFLRQVGAVTAGSVQDLDPQALVEAGLAALKGRAVEGRRLRAVTARLAADAMQAARLALDFVRRRS